MNHLYLVIKNGITSGVYSWEKMVQTFPSPDWNCVDFKDNQWSKADTVDCELKVIRVMINQDMPTA